MHWFILGMETKQQIIKKKKKSLHSFPPKVTEQFWRGSVHAFVSKVKQILTREQEIKHMYATLHHFNSHSKHKKKKSVNIYIYYRALWTTHMILSCILLQSMVKNRVFF